MNEQNISRLITFFLIIKMISIQLLISLIFWQKKNVWPIKTLCLRTNCVLFLCTRYETRCLKLLPHVSQTKGLSPLWIRSWFWRVESSWKGRFYVKKFDSFSVLKCTKTRTKELELFLFKTSETLNSSTLNALPHVLQEYGFSSVW